MQAARALHRRPERRARRRFLAEGAPSVAEALAAGVVEDLFVADADHPLALAARTAGVPVEVVGSRTATLLSDTRTPQGLVAVCRLPDVDLDGLLASSPRRLAVLVAPNDPGNLGTVVRTADAAGADGVVVTGDAVDPWNGKAVRASAGSVFHLDVVTAADTARTLAAVRAAGLALFATTGGGDADLFELEATGALAAPHAWVFGTEAHGLAADVLTAADRRVRIPLLGRAESLNLAAAAAVCLYAGARADTRATPPGG